MMPNSYRVYNISMEDNSSESTFPWEGVVAQYLFSNIKPALSDSEKFISTWIAFNAWMKGQFGTEMTDRKLIDTTKAYEPINKTFAYLKRSDIDFAAALASFSKFEIVNEKTRGTFKFNGDFDSLLETLYTLRGNTFHGADTSGMNSDPHRLAFEILYLLLYKHIFPNKIVSLPGED